MLKILVPLFSVIVVMSNLISTTFFSVLGLSFPAGILLYPISLLLTDLVTEIYGADKARQMIWIAFGMSLVSFGILEMTFLLPGSDLIKEALGKSGRVVIGSIAAYLIGQMLDVKLYSAIKQWTDGRFLWLRTTASMLISQLVDTSIVNWIYLYFGLGFSAETVMRVILFSYLFKAASSFINTPLYYYLVKTFKKESNELAV
jgi:queuosine precursor transporter